MKDIQLHYQAAGGNVLALRMIRRIREEISRLADNPYIAPPYELVPDLRRLVVANGAFLAFCRVAEHVEVVHVRRAERDSVGMDELFGMP